MIGHESRMNGARPGEGYWKVLAMVKPMPTLILNSSLTMRRFLGRKITIWHMYRG
jgi:hypothetical protein